MDNPSFLARRTLGQPNYLLIALAAAFALALIPSGAYQAIQSAANRHEDWLPHDCEQSRDLAWFRQHFDGDQFVLASWQGCSLGNTEKLELLAKKLGGADAGRPRLCRRVITGPEVIDQLTRPPLNLSYSDAIRRVEGSLVGPAKRDAHGNSLGDASRTTCAVVELSPSAMRDNRSMRAAIDRIVAVAERQCGIDPRMLHLGGQPVDCVTLDGEVANTLLQSAAIAAAAGVGLCYWRLRSAKLTAIVFGAAAAGAGSSLAIVYYCGAFEVLVLGRGEPGMGTLDAILLATPAVVYVLGLSAGMHAVSSYRFARLESGVPWAAGAVERAIGVYWRPAALAAITTAAGLACLGFSDVDPVQRLGLFTAAGMLVTLPALVAIFAVVLHRFPISESSIERQVARRANSRAIRGARRLFEAATRRPGVALGSSAALAAALGAGLWQLDAPPQLLNLLDKDAKLVRDYGWIEKNIGNLAPVEIVITMPPERLRDATEYAESDGRQYRLTLLERIELVRDMHRRIESLPGVSGALSAATFAPASVAAAPRGAIRTADYAVNRNLEHRRSQLLAGDYLRMERRAGASEPTGRELWRISARAASPHQIAGVGYDRLLEQLKAAVDPVLVAYQQRDKVTQALHVQSKSLDGARVCVVFRAPGGATLPPDDSQEAVLGALLRRSGAAPRGVTYFNLAAYDRPLRADAAQNEKFRDTVVAALAKQDVVVAASAGNDPTVKKLAARGVLIANATGLPSVEESIAPPGTDDGGPRPIRALVTGIVPVLNRTNGALAAGIEESVVWAMALMLAIMFVLMRSAVAALAALTASALPLVVVFGALGWLGMNVEIGILLAAGAGLFAGLTGAIHYLAWFRRGAARGLSCQAAITEAFEHGATPMVETTLIAGLGMAIFASAALAPIQQLGYLTLMMLALASAANVVLLPAIIASPLGAYFHRLFAVRQPRPTPSIAPAPHIRPTGGDVSRPHAGATPPRIRPVISADDRREAAHGPHSALHAKLQELRRSATRDSHGTH